MDLIIFNGKMKTMDACNPEASAIAVKNGIIEAVGEDESVLKLKTEDTVIVDLKGKTAIPGFNDSHLHNLKYGIFSECADLSNCRSADEIVSVMKCYIKGKNIPHGSWVIGKRFNQDLFEVKELPVKAQLDEISEEHPIVIYRVCSHAVVVNSKALQLLNIDENTPQIEGGHFDIETGIFKENAMEMPQRALKSFSLAELKRFIIKAGQDLLTYGITSIQCDDFNLSMDFDLIVKAYTELAGEGKLPVRICQQCLVENAREFNKFIATDYDTDGTNHFYKLGPMKLLADGSLGMRTAYLSEPYKDAPFTSGMPIHTQEQLDTYVKGIHDLGKAVAIHCIGDQSMHMALESIEKAQKANPIKDVRHGIVHCQITDDFLLKKLKELDVLAYVQPIFLDYDIHIAEERVGREKARTSYAFKTMVGLGVHVSMGTDSPVESFNPFPNIYAAVTRKDLNGYPAEGFFPEECLSVYEAVYCYTVESAYCSYDENRKGRLKKGYLADIAVLSHHIFEIEKEKIKDMWAEMTIVNGKIVYEK